MKQVSIQISVLVAVLAVAVIGIIFMTSQITGMVSQNNVFSYAITDFVDLELIAGNGADTVFNVTLDLADPMINPTEFDSFGFCNGCDVFTIASAPFDESYAGVGSNNQTVCAIIQTKSNAIINVSAKLNESLPAGFISQKITSQAFQGSGSAVRSAENTEPFGFDNASAMTLSASFQPVVNEWHNGSSYGGGIAEDISCKFTINPFVLAAGTYVVRTNFFGEIA